MTGGKTMHAHSFQRGSVLITALLFAAIIAISLGSYIQLALSSAKLANRSFYANAGMNLADTGLEQSLWSLNNSSWTGTAGFVARSGHAGQWQGTFPSTSTYYQFSHGVRGQVKVWVDTATGTPHAVAQATVTLGNGSTVVKMAEAYMQKRSYFANGLVAKNTITFSGNNAAVDSWDSGYDPAHPLNTPIAYIGSGPLKNSRDHGQVGSLSVNVGAIGVNNADINGFVAIGSASLSGVSVGPQGFVGPYGTPNGTIDTSHVTYDFTTSFPDVSAPSSGITQSYTIAAIGSSITLPRAADAASSDGKYYYYVPSISLSGNGTTLSIGGSSAKVVIILTAASGNSVSISGHGGIAIPTGSSLAMYTSANVAIAGNGVANGTYNAAQALSASNTPNQPIAFQLYGTRSEAQVATSGKQNFSISGNGVLSGIVYAPNADVSMNGGGNSGQVLGAMVADTVSLTGNSVFHYDESLSKFGSSNLWAVTKWRELTTTSDRNAYAAQLAF
jgi:hypothetical protein